jgi:hypothetical protein
MGAGERTAWLAAIVRDIDQRRSGARRGLLTDLLRAAWPDPSSQDG